MRRIKTVLSLFAFGITLLGAGPSVRADDFYTGVVKKQETKKQTGWTLSDWLETKNKMHLMDLWLAVNSPSPYEFFLDGNYSLPSQGRDGAWAGQLAAYASIFGLQFEDEFSANGRSARTGIFDVRVFGYYVQSTNITLQAGVRSLTDSGFDYRDAFLGVQMAVYVMRYFGISGTYRHYYDTVPSQSGIVINETRYAGGAFLDFSLLRFYGEYFSQPATYSSGGSSSMVSKTGVTVGARLFL